MDNLNDVAYRGVKLDDMEPGSSHTDTRQYKHRASFSTLKFHLPSPTFWQNARRRTKSFLQDAVTDLRSPGLRHDLYRICTILCPILFIIGLIVVIPVIASSRLYSVDYACRPDSGFYVGNGSYNFWSLSGFFQITLGFGELSFSTAKTINVFWDIVVGRGGQAALVFISYVVGSKVLVRSMESSPVSYGTFEAITLQNGSLTSTLKLIRDMFKNKSRHARITVCWFVISGVFVLSFQTLISAMAGYTANIKSFIEVDTGNLVLYSNFNLIRYIVHDAPRINNTLGNNFAVTTGSTWQTQEIVQPEYSDICAMTLSPTPIFNYSDSDSDSKLEYLDWSTPALDPMCEFYWHVSEYAYNYGLLGLNQTSSKFNNSGKIINLEPPSLNITAFFWKDDWSATTINADGPWYLWPFGYFWKTTSGEQPLHEFTLPLFTNGQFTYDLDGINANGRCQQVNSTYKWGFSFLALFIVILLFILWCLGTYIVWLDAHLHSRLDRAGRAMGIQRAVLDLASCMQKDIAGDGSEMLSNTKLQSKIRKELGGGRITYETLDNTHVPLSRAAELRLRWRSTKWKDWLKRWFKDQKYPFALFVGSLVFLAVTLTGRHEAFLPALFTVLGTGAAAFMGRGHQSRWLVLLACVVVALALIPAGPSVSRYSESVQ